MTMQCVRCGCKSQLPLCNSDTQKLRDMLRDLAGHETDGKQYAGWLENLADAATGHTRMGNDNGRRGGSDEAPIRVNFRASDLMVSVRGTLARIVQELCEDRGLTYVPVRFTRPNFVGPLPIGTLRGLQYTGGGADLALWLLEHADAVVVSVDAGMCFEEIETVINAIKVMIDRPTPPKFFGICPALLDDDQRHRLRAAGHEDRKICSTELKGNPDQIETQCPTCKRVYNAERILRDTIADHADKHYTQAELIGYQDGAVRVPGFMDKIGERVPERTFQRWRKDGKLKPRAYRRPNGRRWGFAKRNEDDEPEYLLLDVLRLKDLEELVSR